MKYKKILSFLLTLLIFSSCFPISAISVNQLNTQLNSKYMILVNREHRLSSTYVPNDLVYFENSGYKLERSCAAALQQMINACPGEQLILYSGYRSYQTQYNKYYGKINQYIANGYSAQRARQLTDQYYAPPGGSEHHTGLAADICTPSIVNRYGQLHESFGNTQEGQWLRNNCWKYGFILRYDRGKENITGYNYEPWHFRYVGKGPAKEIYDLKVTYEEYIEKLKGIQAKLSSPPSFRVTDDKISFIIPKNCEIKYTDNGATPTTTSAKYTKPLSGRDVTYKAIICYQGYESPVTTVTVTKYGDVFSDISVKDWYYDVVSSIVHKDVFQGMGNYKFAPGAPMTRAMLVQVLANISGVNLNHYKNKTLYKDVKANAWYAPAVQWATENSIVQGMGNGIFAPDLPITREQVCVIFYNHSGQSSPTASLPFLDTNKISSWAKNGVSYCAAEKIVNGYPDGSFRPKGEATRAEVAKITLEYVK